MKKGLSLVSFHVMFFFFLQMQVARAAILFEEHFPGPDLPAGWNFDTDGEWSIVDGELEQSRLVTSPGHADAWAGDLTWTDYAVEMRFRFLEFGQDSMEAGLGLRHDSPFSSGNFFVVRVSWRGTSWNVEVVKTLAPEIHLSLNQNLTTGVWYTMKAQIEGNLLQVWVNDILYDFGDISSSEFPIPASGGIGAWVNNSHVRFDDIVVTSPCEVDLAQCEADLTECLTNPIIPDQDEDGESDATDECPNTAGEAAVDQVGCSLEQFCTAIDATTSRGAKVCESSDWRNDEPLMNGKDADCQVQKNGPGRGDDLCVPR
jgi:hypothetical protein